MAYAFPAGHSAGFKGARMRTLAVLLVGWFFSIPAWAQMAPPALDYVPVPESFKLPPGANFGGTSGIAINSKGNLFVLHRGPMPLMEFDADGNFVRGFGDGLFDRPHGLRIDAQDNIWATDVGGHVVYKFNPAGRIEMVLGVKGRPGEMHDFGHLRLFNEPNEAVVGPTGDVYVLQGHGKGPAQVLKFDKDGNYIKAWGKKGKGPGEFDIPHSLVFDAKGLIYIADRSNQRIQVFDGDGNYIRESSHPGTPCGLFITPDQHIWLAHGHTGQIMKLDLNGKVLGTMAGAGQGKTLGKYGEAHYIAVSARDEVFVADTLNWRVQKYVRKK
jgi:DNA-binding beta-propeller fold protein YncE